MHTYDNTIINHNRMVRACYVRNITIKYYDNLNKEKTQVLRCYTKIEIRRKKLIH